MLQRRPHKFPRNYEAQGNASRKQGNGREAVAKEAAEVHEHLEKYFDTTCKHN